MPSILQTSVEDAYSLGRYLVTWQTRQLEAVRRPFMSLIKGAMCYKNECHTSHSER